MPQQQHTHDDKKARNRVRRPIAPEAPAVAPAGPVAPQVALSRLPAGAGARGIRQAAALRLQRQLGNRIARQAIQRQEDDVANPDKIGDDSTAVTARGGIVSVDAGMMNVRTPMAQFDGIIRATTIIADNVIGSSYTPGAGNIM